MRPPDTVDPAVERELAALDAALAGDRGDPALAGLVAAVRDARPEPDPAFRARLDRRAAAGFPREGRRFGWRRRRGLPRLGPTLAIAASMLVALVVAASALRAGEDRANPVAGGGSGAAGGAAGPAAAPRAPEAAQEDAARSAGGAGSTAGGADGEAAPPPFTVPPAAGTGDASDARRARKVERSAALFLTAPRADVASVADRIVRVTDAMGGFVLSSSVRTDDVTGGGGTFELRVRTSRLERTLAELSRLAHVVERTQDARDITAPYASARRRLREARAERGSLLRQLAKADTPNETAGVRARLEIVNRQIDGARADAARVAARTAFATVAVTLSADDAAGALLEDDGRWTPGDAIRDAARVLEFAVGVVVVALAIAVPLALLAVPAAVVWRQGARRRRERALDAV